MVVFRDVFLLPLDPHAQLPFRLPLQVYRHELLQEPRLEPTHLSVVRWLVVRFSYLDHLVLPVLRTCVSRLKAYNPFVGSNLERHINSPCKIVIRPTIMATNPFEPVYPLSCVFLWRALELFRLLVMENWAFHYVFFLFQKRVLLEFRILQRLSAWRSSDAESAASLSHRCRFLRSLCVGFFFPNPSLLVTPSFRRLSAVGTRRSVDNPIGIGFHANYACSFGSAFHPRRSLPHLSVSGHQPLRSERIRVVRLPPLLVDPFLDTGD
ncbi:hypothetical protein OUZ56_033059 [Daphnia magna]|uniref:Uncharacterized protein n=1 Tax=Daphnia magna TaxID=35525 RepID=A0ABR0BA48_9CRUS|nr:hypothetical protein OUZ56_033059 [Daphnia magna]